MTKVKDLFGPVNAFNWAFYVGNGLGLCTLLTKDVEMLPWLSSFSAVFHAIDIFYYKAHEAEQCMNVSLEDGEIVKIHRYCKATILNLAEATLPVFLLIGHCLRMLCDNDNDQSITNTLKYTTLIETGISLLDNICFSGFSEFEYTLERDTETIIDKILNMEV